VLILLALVVVLACILAAALAAFLLWPDDNETGTAARLPAESLPASTARATGPQIEQSVVPTPATPSLPVETLPPLLPPAPAPPGALVQPEDLVYLGAFRLPDDAGPPRTFEYGGNAMTFNPDGDPASTSTDAYPGSLFVMGHDRLAYGGLPDGGQVAEVSIPEPAIAGNPLAPPEWDLVTLGWGVQRRYRIGAVAYDRNNALLYVLELFGEGAKPVVHVWQVEG
jgi:hypothetical protein